MSDEEKKGGYVPPSDEELMKMPGTVNDERMIRESVREEHEERTGETLISTAERKETRKKIDDMFSKRLLEDTKDQPKN